MTEYDDDVRKKIKHAGSVFKEDDETFKHCYCIIWIVRTTGLILGAIFTTFWLNQIQAYPLKREKNIQDENGSLNNSNNTNYLRFLPDYGSWNKNMLLPWIKYRIPFEIPCKFPSSTRYT